MTSIEDKNGSPRVSVLMPVYNRKEYVRAAVESVLGQTYGEFEFVIVNDGSTDGAGEILREYAAADERIVLLEQENQGYTRALNRGLGVARGEYIARMDSDDVCLPERLEMQVKHLDEHPEVAAVGGDGWAVDEDGALLYPMPTEKQHEEIDAIMAGQRLGSLRPLIHPAVTMRRSAVESIGGYRPEFEPAEDRDLFLRLAEVGRLANVDAVVLHYRVHTASASIGRAERQHANALRAMHEAYGRRGAAEPERLAIWSLEDRPRTQWELQEGLALAAARHGQYRSGRKHAIRVLGHRPWRGRAWKALAISVMGRRAAYSLGSLRRFVLGLGRGRNGGVSRRLEGGAEGG